jgi:2-(1,2-epoxy-1,2-dihydrophenyl)acetyl-CoA isomerase
MTRTTIAYDVPEQGVARMTLNRPEHFNALNRAVTEEASEILSMFESDEELKVMILTGAGRSFCAGGDLAWLLEADDTLKKRDIVERAGDLISLLDRMEKPLIAAVNGVAAGAGTALALACDMIIASDAARFAPNFVNIGAVPDSGASWYLPRAAGYHKAAELMLTGRLLKAQEALDMGIFNRVVPAEHLEEETLELARKIVKGPRQAIRSIKKMLKMSRFNSLESQLEVEASLQVPAWSNEEFAEGVKAFLEKRPPLFS